MLNSRNPLVEEDAAKEGNKETVWPNSRPKADDSRPQLGLFEFLDIDDRPTLVFDLTNSTKGTLLYSNPGVEKIPLLGLKLGDGVLSIAASAKDIEYTAFLKWAVSTKEGRTLHFSYCGLWWSAHTLRGRYRFVTGVEGDEHEYASAKRRQAEAPKLGRTQTAASIRPSHSPTQSRTKFVSDDSLEAQIAAFRLREGQKPPNSGKTKLETPESIQKSDTLDRLDFISAYPGKIPSSHHEFFMEFDWASTELGPIASWGVTLRRRVNFLMSDPRPAAMYWGRQRTMMYNEPYMNVTGQKHPGMMGKAFSEAWGEIEGDIIPAFEKAYKTGISTMLDDARFYIERHGYLEETYFSLAMIPFLGDNDDVAFYNPVFDTTRQVIADRRTSFLLRSGQYISSSRDPQHFWQQLMMSLEADNPDVPFAVLYSVDPDIGGSGSEVSDNSQNRNWILQGTIRVPDTPSTIPVSATEQSMESFLPTFAELVMLQTPTVINAENNSLPDFIARDMVTEDGEPEKTALFLPVRSTSDNLVGFLLLGLNPRKRFDADYRVFIELLTRQLATSLASAILFEEEVRRADRERILLSRRLALQKHEAQENETRFRRMADLAPVGIYHIKPDGLLVYCNENYYELTGHPRDAFTPMSWLNVIVDDDIPLMKEEWTKLLTGESVSFEIRLKRPFVPVDLIDGEKAEGPTWILAGAYPQRAADGSVDGILGVITDISRQKWMEGFQKRKMLEAVELKRQQENFIDMTSHEMRNPLSAIVQCADFIGTSLAQYDCDKKDAIIPRDVIEGYAEFIETIVLCAQHQRRIIDDVLTLSKVDSDMLVITPVDVQPFSTLQTSLKMFDVEAQKSNIDLRLQVDDSYSKLAVDWVRLDPSRLLQLLINLVTNAIKFTMAESRKKIVINLGASLEPPTGGRIEYLPRTNNWRDMTRGSAWGTGESVYLHVKVQDSGRGLDEVERTLLFKRFSQTSPRTHVQYGGSGLGLFICRQLTELQGGQIGVTSSVGQGSTFAFYIRARRCKAPTTAPLPLSADRINIPRIASPDIVEKLRTTTLGPTSPSTPRHVLVVEDNIVNQRVLSRQLQSAGCIVSVANHGGEALSFLQKSRFWKGLEGTGKDLSVVLMDLEMPIMDGLTCVKKIRQLQQDGSIVGHVPVIAVTANARSEQISLAKESGMDNVVTKPFTIPALLPVIDRLILSQDESRLERSASAPVLKSTV